MKRDIITLACSMCVMMVCGFAVMLSNLSEISIEDDGELKTYHTFQQTVEEFFQAEGIRVGNFDEVSVNFDTQIVDGMIVEIIRAQAVVINDGGIMSRVMTTEEVVSDMLDEESIVLSDDDEISVSTMSYVGDSTEIEITRVNKEYETETEEIGLDTKYVYTDALQVGKEEVIEVGSPKIIEYVYERVFENGQETTRELVETNVVDEGIAPQVAIGTGPVTTFLANMTAYTADCVGCSGRVACAPYPDVTGNINYYDSEYGSVRIVAASSNYPCGTIVSIAGIGKAIVMDRGGAITGNDLDLLVSGGAWDFGRKYLTTEVLRLGW